MHAVRAGCWLLSCRPASALRAAYDGTLRVESHSGGRTASGDLCDLYQRPTVWQQNNLAQKNLTVVDLAPSSFFVLTVLVRNLRAKLARSAWACRPTPSRDRVTPWIWYSARTAKSSAAWRSRFAQSEVRLHVFVGVGLGVEPAHLGLDPDLDFLHQLIGLAAAA